MKDIVKSQANDEVKYINGRKTKLARRKRRSNLMTYCAVAVAVFTAIGLVVSLCFLFNLEDVEVSGLTLYSNEQVFAAGGVEAGANLIRVNTSQIENQLTETLPYIKSVSVNKVYPHSLQISVTEEQKLADVEYAGRYYVIAQSGKIVEAMNTYHDPALPLVKGFQLKDTEVDEETGNLVKKDVLMEQLESDDTLKAKVLMQLFDAIAASGIKNIVEVDITERTDIKLLYDNRIEIQVGSALDLEYKLTCIKQTIETKLNSGFEGTIRYNNAVSGVSAFAKGAATTTKASTQSAENLQPEQTENTPAQTTASGYTGWQVTETPAQ